MTIKKWLIKKRAYLRGLVKDVRWAFYWTFVKAIRDFKTARHGRALRINFLKKLQEAFNTPDARQPIKNCKHLKGLNHHSTIRKDYNLACHKFIDGRVKIWCLNGCGYAVWNDDTKNFKKAFELMELSSNTTTTSEQPLGSENPNGRA